MRRCHWNFPSAKRWQVKMVMRRRERPRCSPVHGEGCGMQPGEWREVIWDGERGQERWVHALSRYPIPPARRVLHRPVWIFAASRGRYHLHHPPMPQKASLYLGFCQKLLKKMKRKHKQAKENPPGPCKLCSLRRRQTLQPKRAKKAGRAGGWGPGLGGVPGSAASSPADSGKEPNIHTNKFPV